MNMRKTQCETLLWHMQTKGPITNIEASNMYGICRISARVKDLRDRGYPVKTEWRMKKHENGRVTQYGVFSL